MIIKLFKCLDLQCIRMCTGIRIEQICNIWKTFFNNLYYDTITLFIMPLYDCETQPKYL